MANWPTCLVADLQAAPKAAMTFTSALELFWRCSALNLSYGCRTLLCIALSELTSLKTERRQNPTEIYNEENDEHEYPDGQIHESKCPCSSSQTHHW